LRTCAQTDIVRLRGATDATLDAVGTVEGLDQGGLKNNESVNIQTNYTTFPSGQLWDGTSFLTSKVMMLMSFNKLLKLKKITLMPVILSYAAPDYFNLSISVPASRKAPVPYS
jgi:hypothetical protein